MGDEVRSGDTRGAIARRHGTSVPELQRLNGIADPDRIRAGQPLRLPAGDAADGGEPASAFATPAPRPAPAGTGAGAGEGSGEGAGAGAGAPTSTGAAAPVALAAGAPGADAAGGGDEPWSTTLLRVVDAIGRPIAGLRVRLVPDRGREAVARTDADGCLPPLRCASPDIRVEIRVERAAHAGGGEKRVAWYRPLPGEQAVTLRSPRQVETTRTRRHEAPPAFAPSTMQREAAGAKLETATPAGHPLTCVKCGECPNEDDLRLGVNAEYRDDIVAAARRAGMMPQAVAALIGAEAAKDRRGKWQRNSRAPQGSATGLTQFLDRTWIEEALRPGTYLHDQAIVRKWVVLGDDGSVRFARNDGVLLSSPGLGIKLRKLLVGPRSAADANLQALLDLRYQADCSINAALDYANSNLRQLARQGRRIGELNDTQRARVMYLCHHLGLQDAGRFIERTMSSRRARELLIQQVGAAKAEHLCSALGNGDWAAAHRGWLSSFVSLHVVPRTYSCPGARFDRLHAELEQSELVSITERLRVNI